MSSQHALFMDFEQSSLTDEVAGFRHQAQIVSEDGDTRLASVLGQLDLKPFDFHGYQGNRRVISFGFKYNYLRRAIETASTILDFLGETLSRVADFVGCPKEDFRQIGINEYRLGAEIGWHKDKLEFGIVFGRRARRIGRESLTSSSLGPSTFFQARLARIGSIVSRHSKLCVMRLTSARFPSHEACQSLWDKSHPYC